jgi:chromosome segregation ATPase
MSYTQLKEKLQQLLTEDLSNRASLQESRRNLFLNSEGSKVQQQLIEQKQSEIASLSTLVEKKKTIVQLKDDEIAVLRNNIKDLEAKIQSAENSLEEERKTFDAQVAELTSQAKASKDLESKLSGISLQNEEYAGKIRELILHIDAQNTEIENWKNELSSLKKKASALENLKSELASVKDSASVTSKQLLDKTEELESLRSELAALKATPVIDTQALEAKESEITNLRNEIESLKNSWNAEITSKDSELSGLRSEIESIKTSWNSESAAKESALNTLRSEIESLKSSWSADSATKDSEITSLKNELETLKAIPSVDMKQWEEKTAEAERLQEKADLLAESEQQLKMLVSSQNSEIENLNKQVSGHKKQIEDIAGGWQHQQEQLLADNSNLLAELAMLKESMITEVVESAPIVSTISDEQITSIQAEKEQLSSQLQAAATELATLKESINHQPAPLTSTTPEEIEAIRIERDRLCMELEATRYELDITTQQREEKIVLLQSELSSLQNQVISLSDSLNRESEEKNLIGTQLEQLKSIVTEKEQALNQMSNNSADEEFIDKLMFQANRLNDEKHRLELLYTESEAELTLTRTNLATLTQLIEEQKTSISGLDATDKHVKLAQTLMLQVSDRTAAKQAINELVREIDKCIALLSE